MSHPSWVRGLKQIGILLGIFRCNVAPLVGAWIETFPEQKNCPLSTSHPSWVRGLKL